MKVVVGSLCSWNPSPKSTLFFDGRSSTMGAEEFRTLRSHLYLIRGQRELQKLLITSPLRLEGKTFTAVNLAGVLVRQKERRALLIDADLRSSKVHLALGAPLTPGLSDYLSGAADEFAVIQRGSVDNLYFIPGGKPAADPSELIGNGRLKLLLERLAPVFDWIIIDSPPVVPVSDAKLLADLCDGILVVIHAGVTPSDLAQRACQEFREKDLLGVVLNRVDAGTTYGSYYQSTESGSKKKGKVEGDKRP
jgi:capsular exopolysaccharide synthesis family protein